MKLPQTSEDVKAEILISSDKAVKIGDLRIRQFIKILGKVDQEIIVDGVIKVFETNRPDSLYQDQEFAGRILATINPKSKRELNGILKRTLWGWDKSGEQLPLWFRDNYGLDKVLEAPDNIDVADHERQNIETMKFWLRVKATNASHVYKPCAVGFDFCFCHRPRILLGRLKSNSLRR
jgi:hypothetical protein